MPAQFWGRQQFGNAGRSTKITNIVTVIVSPFSAPWAEKYPDVLMTFGPQRPKRVRARRVGRWATAAESQYGSHPRNSNYRFYTFQVALTAGQPAAIDHQGRDFIMAWTNSEIDEQIERLRKGDTLAENEVKALCEKVSNWVHSFSILYRSRHVCCLMAIRWAK
jgi:hypothetical protein